MTCYMKRMGEGLSNRAIKHLPEELIAEILLSNLPVKSLLRFKSVSKSWRSLISSPKLVKDHLNRSNSDPDLAHPALIATFYDELTGYSLRSCSLKPLIHHNDVAWDHHPHPTTGNTYLPIEILGSCNGLILIDIKWSGLYLWNPSTRKLKTIPPPSSSYPHHEFSFAYGCGYDDSTDDYKVVCIIYRTRGYAETLETKICSVRTGSWKKIDNFVRNFNFGLDCEGKFVNGKLHWVGVGNGVWDIVSLGLVEGEEKYQVVASPECFSDSDTPKLENWGGYLSLLGRSFVGTNGMMDINIWVMMEYDLVESWTKIWTLSNCDHPPRYIYMPFWLTKNGDFFVHLTKWVPRKWSMFEDVSRKSEVVVVYNRKNKLRKRQIGKVELPDKIFPLYTLYRHEPIAYVESLVSP